MSRPVPLNVDEEDGPVFYKGLTFPVLDHGHVIVRNWMGSEQDIVDSARLSYGQGTKSVSEDRNLIRYLIRHHHTTPLESCELQLDIKLPIFVARQLIRHRVACLKGNTVLGFETPYGKKAFPVTIKKFHDMWHQKTKQVTGAKKKPTHEERVLKDRVYSISELAALVERRPENLRTMVIAGKLQADRNDEATGSEPVLQIKGEYYHTWANATFIRPTNNIQERLKLMRLRMLDEELNTVDLTSVTDIWKSGKKTVYQITLENNQIMSGLSKNHLCYTDKGWLKLKEFINLETGEASAKLCSIKPRGKNPWKHNSKPIDIDLKAEKWKWIKGLKGDYKVSNFGRIKSYKWNRKTIKTPTVTEEGYYLVSLQLKDGSQCTQHVHVLVANTWLGNSPKNKPCVRHDNGNRQDNRPENIFWSSKKDNAQDTIKHENTAKLRPKFVRILSIKNLGKHMTYDLSVAGPYHNFMADGVIVHNSLNEVSARYSELPNEMYEPENEHWGLQAKNNKQGRDETAIDKQLFPVINKILKENNSNSYAAYQKLLDMDVARELARMVLPVNTYTHWIWKIDVNNLMKLLKLRQDLHAQYEIRVYADAMAECLHLWMPNVYDAYIDYVKEAVTLSKQQFALIKDWIQDYEVTMMEENSIPEGMSKREFTDLLDLFK